MFTALLIMRRAAAQDHSVKKRSAHDSVKEARKIHHSSNNQKRDDRLVDSHHQNKSVDLKTTKVKKSKISTSHEAGDTSYQGLEPNYYQQNDAHSIDVKHTKTDSLIKTIQNRGEKHEQFKRKHHSDNREKTKLEATNKTNEHQTGVIAHHSSKVASEKEIIMEKQETGSFKKQKSHHQPQYASELMLKLEKTRKETEIRESADNQESFVRQQREANIYHKDESQSIANTRKTSEGHLVSSKVGDRFSFVQENRDILCSIIEEKKLSVTNNNVDLYEDDFENYTSDFDDAASESNSSCNSSQNNHENKTKKIYAPTASEHRPQEFPETPNHREVPTSTESSVASDNVQLIDFNRSLNLQQHAVHHRLKRRAADLMRLIELEYGNFVSVLDMRPLDEYSNYMVRFGQANRSQVAIQTQDDALDREVQTETIEFCPGGGIWTQWPPLDNGECSGKFERLGQNTICHSTSENLNEGTPMLSYLDEVIKDFSSVSSLGTLSGVHKHEDIPLPQSLLPKLRLITAVITEECIPELFGPALDVTSKVDEQNLRTQHLFCPGDSEMETSDAQASIHGNSGCVACAFAPCNGDMLLTIHRPATIPQVNPLSDRTGFVIPAGEVIYVWSISGESSAPKYQLYCPGLSETGLKGANITRAIFSPDSDASMVIGGLVDGSICVWDLRATNHNYEKSRLSSSVVLSDHTERPQTDLSYMSKCARAPIYSTSGVEVQHITGHWLTTNEKVPLEIDSFTEIRKQAENQLRGKYKQQQQKRQHHSASIIEVQLMHLAVEKSTRSNFQFAALDSAGELSLWMILKPNRVRNFYEALIGSQTDLGLRPQENTIQMVCLAYLSPTFQLSTEEFCPFSSSTEDDVDTEKTSNNSKWLLHLRAQPKVNATALSISCLGDFLVGFSDGTVSKLSRSPSQVVYPRQFAKPFNKAAVLCLATHPNPEFEVFLVGYADGYVRLYHLNQPNLLYQWNLSEHRGHLLSTVKLIWSHTRPTVFFSLDSSGRVSSLDLLKTLRDNLENDTEQVTDDCVGCNYFDGVKVHVASAASDENRIYDFALSSGVLVSSYGHVQLLAAFALIYPEAVKVHWLDTQWSSASVEEIRNSRNLFQQLILGH